MSGPEKIKMRRTDTKWSWSCLKIEDKIRRETDDHKKTRTIRPIILSTSTNLQSHAVPFSRGKKEERRLKTTSTHTIDT